MGDNPNRQHYQAEPDPNSPGRGAGSGEDFATDLQRLYEVGRVKLPEIAQDFSEASTTLDNAKPSMKAVAEDMAGIRCMKDLLWVRQRLQVATYKTTLAAQDSGDAVLRLVDLFATVDEVTAEAFNGLSSSPEFRDNYEGPRPKVDPPADPHEPDYEPEQPNKFGRGGVLL